jgi:hypothetical protein
MSDLPPVPPSPGVGFRRKGPQGLPTLPLSAFSAPNSSASDSFPIPESPSTTHPEAPIDAFVADPAAWASSAGDVLGKKAAGIVLTAGAEKAAEAIASLVLHPLYCVFEHSRISVLLLLIMIPLC